MNVSLTTSIEPQFRTIDGLRIRYAESSGSQDPVVLLTSPWPESLYAFAPMWATLAQNARLFAVDLPGFGASERREDLLSARAMGGFLAELIAEADLGKPHIVAPDVGTSAALFAAAVHPERIASVIVGTGGAAVPLQLGEPLASWVLDPDLDKYAGWTLPPSSAWRWTRSRAGYPTTFARTTSPATSATASPSRCAMSRGCRADA
jgi:pimeloyl-ACP methyl ester carboxylesterase